MKISRARHLWPNPPDFILDRKDGYHEYSFVHFTSGADMVINGRRLTIHPHGCIIYAPKTPQYFYSESGIIHDWFHFDGVEDGFFKGLGLPVDEVFYPKKWHFITDLVQEIETELFSKKSHNDGMMQIKATELFILLSRSVNREQTDPVAATVSDRLKKLRQKMLSSLERPWTVSVMAGELSMSESHFYNLYRSYYGTSPINDLIHARIDAARYALQFTDRAVGDIALSLGYNNVTHFSRQFHSVVGTSPMVYKKEKQRLHGR